MMVAMPHKVPVEQLDAAAELWSRGRREFATSFGGTSMLPAIRPGQWVTVVCGAIPAVGDIAVYRFEDQLRVHRVALRAATWILTWGDANPLPDEPVSPACIVGIVKDIPAPPRSFGRAIVRHLLGSATTPVDVLTRRICRLYRIKTVWAEGPLAFARAVLGLNGSREPLW